MNFEDDERAQSVLVGAILLFAILIIAFSSYQAFVVPNQNAGVEFNHNQQVQDDMQDMRSAILRTGGFGNVQSAGIQLGTTYPSRLIALNPPTSSGTLETNAGGELEVEILSGTPENEQLEAYWDGAGGDPTTFTTQRIEYQPSYTEYHNPPNTVLEHSILYNRFDAETTLPQNQQAILSGQSLSFVFIDGEYSRSQSGKVELDAKPVSAPSNRVAIGGPVEIRLETELSEERWEEDLFEDEIEDGEVEILDFNEGDPNEIELRFNDDYTLRLAKVGAGTQLESPDAAYIVRVGGETARVEESFAFEVRDRYNNPVSGVEIDLDGVAGPRKTDSDGRVIVSRNSPGEVTASVGGEDWEEATVNVLEAGEGDSTNGPATVVDEPENDITVTEGDGFRLDATANSVGTTAAFRSGTPIQSFIWESSGPDGEERSDEFDDLDPDETNRVVSRGMEIDTDGWEIGDHEISIIAQDATGRETSVEDRGTVTVTVEEKEENTAFFDVEITNFDEEVTEGDEVTVDYTITNTGEQEDTQDIEFRVDGTLEDAEQDVTLDGGQTFSGSFTYQTEEGDAPEVTVEVASNDDSESRDVIVNEDEADPATVEVVADEAMGNNDDIDTTFDVENDDGTTNTINVFLDDQAGGGGAGTGANGWAAKTVTIDGGEFTLTGDAADNIGVNLQDTDLFDAANYEDADQGTLDDLSESITVDSDIPEGSITHDGDTLNTNIVAT